MAQYRIHDPEELLECPYDKVHMVRAKRFQYHLKGCRANYKGREYVACTYNAGHVMPKPEHRHHESVCPDRNLVNPEFAHAARLDNGDDNTLRGCTETPNYSAIEVPSSEDWDSEPHVSVRVGPRYDPAYYEKVQFKDVTQMDKVDRAIVRDRRLTSEQKISELSNDSMHISKSSPVVASGRQPRILPKEQPMSSVFAFSTGRGRGQSIGNGVSGTFPPFGSGNPAQQSMGAIGIGRGIGRGLTPPPGFR